MSQPAPSPNALPKRRLVWSILGVGGMLAGAIVLPLQHGAHASGPDLEAAERLAAAEEREALHNARYHGHGTVEITLAEQAQIQLARRSAMQGMQVEVAALPRGAQAWEAQLGAFSSADAAERQRAKLAAADVAPARIAVRTVGALHRLASAPMASRAQAARICAAASTAGVECFVRQSQTS